ncbi:MAG TPA: type IX secretion system membrane protein PorP/SprF [Bacteroidales bacterium]|nr:type IX secretion system membrane protein PorP/SprF [Bacteroidales bacterium]
MRISILFLCLFCFLLVNGQSQYSYYPVQFSQYMRHYQFINPASIGSDTKLGTTLGSRNHIGNFSSISTYFAGFSYSVKNPLKTDKPFNVLGLKVDTDQEGKYIARSRFYLAYAFHFKIFGDYYLSGGIDFGALNLSVKGTPSVGDKSEFVPDANSGIWFYKDDFHLGISVTQIFNGRLQPYQEISQMRRHINITVMKQFRINSYFAVRPSFLVRFPSYLNYNADYSIECEVYDFIGGFSLRHKLGGAFWLGVKNIGILGGKLEAVLCYNTPLKRSLININSLEIICRYGL